MVYQFLFITLKKFFSLIFDFKGILQHFELENSIFDVMNRAYDSEYFFVQEYILHFSSTFEISIKASEPT
jgi:hypothetical protein